MAIRSRPPDGCYVGQEQQSRELLSEIFDNQNGLRPLEENDMDAMWGITAAPPLLRHLKNDDSQTGLQITTVWETRMDGVS